MSASPLPSRPASKITTPDPSPPRRGLSFPFEAFDAPRAAWIAALVVAVLVGALISLTFTDISKGLGDTDDALRLVLVRDLMHGRGWWDQHLMRLQPPYGLWMQWSRLIDGGIVLTERLFGLFMPPDRAELMARILWPQLWMLPAVAGVLFAGRALAPQDLRGPAVFAAAVACLLAPYVIYRQFIEGRIDHHGPQIAMCLVAVAGAVQRGRGIRGPLIAGIATGVGLVVGLEALAFEALVGVLIAVRFIRDPGQGRGTIAYAAGLVLTLWAGFLIQTPPARWGLSFCDGLGLNLAGAIGAAGAGLIGAVLLTRDRGPLLRLAAVGAAGLVAAAVFVSLEPACLAGPFAQIDPRIRPIWLDRVSEVKPLTEYAIRDPQTFGAMLTPQLLGLVAVAALGWMRRKDRPLDLEVAFWALLLFGAFELGMAALRMTFYGAWLSIPPVAALAAELIKRWRRTDWIAVAAVSFGCSAAIPAMLVSALFTPLAPAKPKAPTGPDRCSQPASYRTLAALPAGLAVSEIDLGPYVVAATPSSALSAPYHRMGWGIMQAHGVMSAPSDVAEQRARALGVAYVLECRRHSELWKDFPNDSLQRRLDAGQVPAWLEARSRPDDPVQVYVVRRTVR